MSTCAISRRRGRYRTPAPFAQRKPRVHRALAHCEPDTFIYQAFALHVVAMRRRHRARLICRGPRACAVTFRSTDSRTSSSRRQRLDISMIVSALATILHPRVALRVAKTRASLPAAIRGYKEINLRAMRLRGRAGVFNPSAASSYIPCLRDARSRCRLSGRASDRSFAGSRRYLRSSRSPKRYLKGPLLD